MTRDLPQLPADHFLWSYVHRNLGRTPHWTFPDLLLGRNLRCERLGFHNFDDLWPLLATDPSPHIDDRFRTRAGLYAYTVHLMAVMPYASKHGGADYLVVDTPGRHPDYATRQRFSIPDRIRLDEGDRLVGVLHLYDLSRERFDGRMPNPFVGLQLISAVHGTGIAARALSLLEKLVAETYPAEELAAVIHIDNRRSQRFFRKQNYLPADDRYGGRPDYCYVIKPL